MKLTRTFLRHCNKAITEKLLLIALSEKRTVLLKGQLQLCAHFRILRDECILDIAIANTFLQSSGDVTNISATKILLVISNEQRC